MEPVGGQPTIGNVWLALPGAVAPTTIAMKVLGHLVADSAASVADLCWDDVVRTTTPSRVVHCTPDARPTPGTAVEGQFMHAWDTAVCSRVASDRQFSVAVPARFQDALKRPAAGFTTATGAPTGRGCLGDGA